MITLGAEPDRLVVHVTTGADFSATLVYKDANGVATAWPTGTTLTLDFGTVATAWTATIAAGSSDAVFDVDKATADTIPANTAVSLRYVNGTTDQTWGLGKVVRHG